MKKIADIVAFFFLSTLVVMSGLLMLTVRAQVEPDTLTVPNVTTDDVTDITASSATAFGTVNDNGGEQITRRGFAIALSLTELIGGEVVPVPGTVGAFEYGFIDLNPNTTYFVTAFATNSIGTSYGDPVEFITLHDMGAGALPFEVQTYPIPFDSVSNTSAEIIGSVISDGGLTLLERGAVVATTVDPTIADMRFEHGSTTSGTFTVTVNGLTPSTTYHTRAYATNEQETVYGANLTFTTHGNSSGPPGEEPPPPCGNGIVEAAEECDDGDANSDTTPNACRATCTWPICGDHVTDTSFGDECDGGENCSTTCDLIDPLGGLSTTTPPQDYDCGNGTVEGDEECDGGANCSATCELTGNDLTPPPTTTPPRTHECGNDIVEGEEECDGGANCSATCELTGNDLTPPPTTTPPGGTDDSPTLSPTLPRETPPSDTSDNGDIERIAEIPILLDDTPPPPRREITQEDMVVRFQERCVELGVTDSGECQQLLILDINPECRLANVHTPSDCEALLKARHLDRLCAELGIDSREACQETLIRDRRQELICGGIEREECETLARDHLIGQISSGIEKREVLRDFIEQKETRHATIKELVEEIERVDIEREIIPIHDDHTEPLLLIPSEETIDVTNEIEADISLPYLLVLDDDGDGLPNDLELIYGTDPKNSDSDGDGFTDKEEVANGYDPLITGGDKVERILSTVERAVLDERPIEQPTIRGTENADYVINTVVPKGEDTPGHTIRGHARPDTTVLVYIYSDLPMVLTVQTDEFGNWTYDLQQNLIDGKHTMYVAITDETGKIEEKSSPLTFFVRRAQAVTVTNFLEDEPISFIQTAPVIRTSTPLALTRYYLIGGFVIIAIGLLTVLLIVRSRKRLNV